MFLKMIISYLVCLSTPKAIVDAINEAASVSDMEGSMLEQAGFRHEA